MLRFLSIKKEGARALARTASGFDPLFFITSGLDPLNFQIKSFTFEFRKMDRLKKFCDFRKNESGRPKFLLQEGATKVVGKFAEVV